MAGFPLVAVAGTAMALVLSLLSSQLRHWSWSSWFGCALAGASLGSFAAALLLLAYPIALSGLVGQIASVVIAGVFGLGPQKSVVEGRVPFLPSNDS